MPHSAQSVYVCVVCACVLRVRCVCVSIRIRPPVCFADGQSEGKGVRVWETEKTEREREREREREKKKLRQSTSCAFVHGRAPLPEETLTRIWSRAAQTVPTQWVGPILQVRGVFHIQALQNKGVLSFYEDFCPMTGWNDLVIIYLGWRSVGPLLVPGSCLLWWAFVCEQIFPPEWISVKGIFFWLGKKFVIWKLRNDTSNSGAFCRSSRKVKYRKEKHIIVCWLMFSALNRTTSEPYSSDLVHTHWLLMERAEPPPPRLRLKT